MGRLVREDGKGGDRLVKERFYDEKTGLALKRPINKLFTMKVLFFALPLALLMAIPFGFFFMVKLTWDFWQDNLRKEHPEGIFSNRNKTAFLA